MPRSDSIRRGLDHSIDTSARGLPPFPWRILAALSATVLLILSTSAAAQTSVTLTVPGFSDPFLAGQSAGATSHGDSAPAESPPEANIAFCAGSILNFINAMGLCNFVPGTGIYSPEGGTTFIAATPADLGISGITAPVCGLLGVFLSDGTNSGNAPPSGLTFGTSALRDFQTLSPQLYQLFYIGDGLKNDLTTVQSFLVPSGATRLFLGILDGFGWYNNVGSFNVTVSVASLVCAGSSLSLGTGCGPDAPLLSSNTPISGSTLTVSLATNFPSSAGVLGFTPPIESPVTLGGCLIYLDLALLNTIPVMTDALGAWSLSVGIPPPPGIAGVQVTLQAAFVNPMSPLGASISNGLLLTIGA